MAITSAEIHNQSFSIDRKGYDVDEVDVFLEHVADEIDGMNAQIAQLENQLDDRKFEGFDTPARVEAPVVVTDDAALAEIGGEMPASLPVSAHARPIDVVETTATGRVTAPAQAPINRDGAGAYSVPQATGAVVAPATPTPSGVEKDLSGFGDADDAFEFEEID